MSHTALLVPTIDRIGGAERQVLVLAAGLRRRGWKVTVVSLAGTGGSAAAELAGNGIGYLSLEMRKGLLDPRGWLRLRAWLRSNKPDVVHAHLPHAAWLARASRLLAPCPAVVDTIHSACTGKWPRRFGYRLTRMLPDRVIAVSNSAAETHLAAGMIEQKRLTVVYNGVDTDEWRPDRHNRDALRNRFGFGDEFIWLAAARLEPVKDFATMLRAFVKVAGQSRLMIAGAGAQRRELEQLAAKIGVGQRVQFLGHVADACCWMQAADGFVLTSLWEGLPMSVIEAAACELPQVATRVAGTREAIEDGVTGLLAEPKDIAGLAAAMNHLMQMPLEERRMMGILGRERVMDKFSLKAALDTHEALYRELLIAKTSGHTRLKEAAAEATRRPAPAPDEAGARSRV